MHKRRAEASDADSYGSCYSKEKEGHDKRHFQPFKRREINHREADTSDKVQCFICSHSFIVYNPLSIHS